MSQQPNADIDGRSDEPIEVDLTLFVACYNEEEGIIPTLDTLRAAMAELRLTWEIIVIDDGSRDRSVELVKRYMLDHPDVPIVLKAHLHNQGLGYNYVDAAFMGRGRYFRFICGDNPESKEGFVRLFSRVGEADMILPYLATDDRALGRRILSGAYNRLVNAISGRSLRYWNGSAVHLRYNVLRWHSYSRGFGFQADMVNRMLDLGATYVEVPMDASEKREASYSSALKVQNILSVGHTLSELLIRRLGVYLYRAHPADRAPEAHYFRATEAGELVCLGAPPAPVVSYRIPGSPRLHVAERHDWIDASQAAPPGSPSNAHEQSHA